MDSVLEIQRQTHEDVERLEEAAVELLMHEPRTHHDRLLRDHKVDYILQQIGKQSQSLLELYADRQGARSSEMEGVDEKSGPGGLARFYEKYQKVKEYHDKYPDVVAEDWKLDLSALEGEYVEGEDLVDRLFSGEEMGGRFLDLNFAHDRYINLKDIKRNTTYLIYLDDFEKFHLIPKSTKLQGGHDAGPAYSRYLRELGAYLRSFWKRTRPLTDLAGILDEIETNFDEQWRNGVVIGWETSKPNGHALDHLNGTQESQQTGMDAADSGIYCKFCKKSYAKQTVFDAHLRSKKHLKAVESTQGAKETSQTALEKSASLTRGNPKEIQKEKEKILARDEYIIRALIARLDRIRVETKANVERKQALTDKERRAEIEAVDRGGPGVRETRFNGVEGELPPDDDQDDDEDRIHNPLKLPLGWDGKPIPFWLYKLHGLGVEYPCEICSGFVYKGRRNFERHFQEPRHAFGLKALGLPNTRHFYGITKVADALALADKLKKEGRKETTARDNQEEVEDAQGNVFPRKVWEDLKRQGLV